MNGYISGMMKRLLVLVLMWMLSVAGQAQEEVREPFSRHMGKLELGMNVTSVISSFSGNGTFLEASDLPLLLRIRGRKWQKRIGLGAASNSNSFFDFVSQSERTSKSNELFLKVGLEKIIDQNDRWEVHAGFDFIGSGQYDVVDAISFNSVSKLEKIVIGAGLSPFLGFKYSITESLYLSTEAALNFLFSREMNDQTLNGVPLNSDGSSDSYDLTMNPPLFLYLTYSLGR